jgi:hypothetical protein
VKIHNCLRMHGQQNIKKISTLISLVEMHGPEDESTMNIPSVSNYLATNRPDVTVQKTLFFSTG